MQQLTNTEKVQLQSWNTVRLKAQKKHSLVKPRIIMYMYFILIFIFIYLNYTNINGRKIQIKESPKLH